MRPTLLYVIGAYPQRSETFIRREVERLRAHAPVRVLALRDGDGGAPAPPSRGRDWPTALRLLPDLLHACRDARQRLQVLSSLPRLAAGLALPRGGIARVHAHFSTVPALVGMHLARALGVPFSFTAHAYDLFASRSLFAAVAPAAEFIIVPAEYHRRWIAARHGAVLAAKARVVRCGVPDYWLRYPPCDAQAANCIVAAGRLVPKKGFDTLLRALARLDSPDWRIAGDGPEAGMLRALAAFDPQRDARLLPWQEEGELRRLLRRGIAVFPCRTAADGDRDGLPVTLLEAMALGCPVVATPVAGIPEAITDGENGLLVPENDDAALAAALRRLLADGKLRARLGAAARETMRQQFTQARSTRELLDAFGVSAARSVPVQRAQPLRVLRVINNLAIGGAQRLLWQWAQQHDRSRFATVVAAFAGGPLAAELAAAGISVHIVPRRGKCDATLVPRLARLMRDERIDLVHAQLFAAKLWARLAARRAGIPCAVSDYAIHPRTRRWPYPQLERRLAPYTAGWAVDHPALAEHLIARHGAMPERVTVTPSGVEMERLRPVRGRVALREALGMPDGAYVALGLGRLAEQKNWQEFLTLLAAAAAPVRAQLAEKLRLVLVGDGEQRAALAMLVAQAGMEGMVHFAGEQRDIGDWLAAADVLVMPSRWEGMPVAALEAAVVGLPVVATDLPGLRALADAHAGITLCTDTVELIALLQAWALHPKQRPPRMPCEMPDAAAYARTLAEWYEEMADARA